MLIMQNLISITERLPFLRHIYSGIKKPSFVSDKRRFMERMTRLELATSTLARWRSTR